MKFQNTILSIKTPKLLGEQETGLVGDLSAELYYRAGRLAYCGARRHSPVEPIIALTTELVEKPAIEAVCKLATELAIGCTAKFTAEIAVEFAGKPLLVLVFGLHWRLT